MDTIRNRTKTLVRHRWFNPMVALLAAFILIGIVSTNQIANLFFEQVSWRTTDLLIRAGGHVPTDPRIAVIVINDQTIGKEQGYGERLENWDRSIHAALINRLDLAGARAVAFSLLFLGDAHSSDESEFAPGGDEALVTAIRRSSMPVLLSAGQQAKSETILKPPAALSRYAYDLGHANVQVDHDLVVRRVQAEVKNSDEQVPALGLAAAAAYWRLPKPLNVADDLQAGELVNGVSLPTADGHSLLVNFDRPRSYYLCEYASFMRTDSGCDQTKFADKLVFVGWGLSDGADYHATPSGHMNGVEIHANLAASLLTDGLLHEQPAWAKLLIVLLVAFVVGLFFTTQNTFLILITECLCAVSIIGISLFSFQTLGTRVDVAGPLMTMFIISGLLLAIQNMVNRKDRGMVLELFKNQTSPQVVKTLLTAAENGSLELGGEERVVSIVFFDMRNFTKISEYLTPQEIVQIINTYIAIITDSIILKGGTLTSYAGDQVMAIFNAPVSMEHHADRAIRAAQFTMDRIEAFNLTNEADALPVKAHFGAGVETGNVIVGNIGSINHHNYTAIGDPVNVASRLCNLAPPSTIFVGGTNVNLASEQCKQSLQLMGGQTLKGRQGVVQIYQSSHAVPPKLLALPNQLPVAHQYPVTQTNQSAS